MVIIGTCHFPSTEHAYRYYQEYGYSRLDVYAKLKEGEIKIGLPTCKLNEQVILIDNNTRYAVVTTEEKPTC